jgi:hypothetical protein
MHIFMALPGQEECTVELNYNWEGDDGFAFGRTALWAFGPFGAWFSVRRDRSPDAALMFCEL